MDLFTLTKIALRGIRRTPLRSGLTTLGIVIGVAAMIAMVSIGSGTKARVEELMAGFDTTQLRLSEFVPFSQWRDGRPPDVVSGEGIGSADYLAIREEAVALSAASPRVVGPPAKASAAGRSLEVDIVGFDVEGFAIFQRVLLDGTFFGASDVDDAACVAVITDSVANAVFQDRRPLGKVVRLNGIPFRIIGIVADDEKYRNMTRLNAGDTEVFIPYTSLIQRLDRNAAMSIQLEARSPEHLGVLRRHVSDLMEKRRGGRTVEFKVYSASDRMERYVEGSRTMSLLLAAVGSVSLTVGGIGIMNIMLVNVAERTREIGVRLAIGTRSRDVLNQFLVEALTLSLFGGAVGVVLGVVVAYLFMYLNRWPTQVTVGAVLGAFFCSAIVGVLFGYYPARRAARSCPVEALRSE